MSGFRLADGGALIDRSRPVGFSFDGRPHTGFVARSDVLAAFAAITGT